MPNIWMVRSAAGERIEDFEKGWVGLGFHPIGDLTNAMTIEAVREACAHAWPEAKKGKILSAAAMLYKFRMVLQQGDRVVTYDPAAREYLVGTIEGEYLWREGVVEDSGHLRRVHWDGRVSRDRLSVGSRNSLGSTLTLFSIAPDVFQELATALANPAATPAVTVEEESGEIAETREDTQERAHELIKDRILKLTDGDLEYLTAALLCAMGFRSRVMPKGPDRGVDVLASPDGLGLQEPRIKAEVKHRPKSAMGSPEIRSFLGGLRPGDRGLYVSTGGFTKEGKYEAERSNTPVTLVDLDDLASLVVTHYDRFDSDGRALMPLVKVYWPSE